MADAPAVTGLPTQPTPIPADAPEVPVISTPFYADKSFWLVVLGILSPLISAKLGVSLNVEAIASMFAGIIAFVTMSKWKQATMGKQAMINQASAAGQAAAPATALNQ